MHQVIVTHPAFAEAGVSSSATGGYYHRSKSALEKIISVIETRTVYGRWMSGIFRRAEYNDGIRRMKLLHAARAYDFHTQSSNPARKPCP